MRLPISLRVALLTALLTLSASLAVIGFIHWRTHDDTAATFQRQIVEEASALDDVYASGGTAGLRGAVADILAARDPQYAVAILRANGSAVAGNLIWPAGARLTPGYHTGPLHPQSGGTAESAYVIRRLPDGGWLISGRALGERLALQRVLERSLALSLAISLLFGLASGFVVSRYVASRVRNVARVADRIADGDLAQRLPTHGGGDAFDGLAEQVNRMLDRIAALMAELRVLTDSLAHDLRSPLSRLRARVETAVEAEDAARRDAALAGILREADSLMRILTTVLEIGRAEAHTPRHQFAWLDPAELVEELTDMYEPIAEEAGAPLRLERDPVLLPLFGHRQLLAQALSNLLDNALSYGAAGGELRLLARLEDSALRLGVADRGVGIALADHAEARRQFGRLDAARPTAGAGLGLALVEAVARLHHGRLDLGDNDPGLIATLVIPVRPDTAVQSSVPL